MAPISLGMLSISSLIVFGSNGVSRVNGFTSQFRNECKPFLLVGLSMPAERRRSEANLWLGVSLGSVTTQPDVVRLSEKSGNEEGGGEIGHGPQMYK